MPESYRSPPPDPGDPESPFLSEEFFAREEPEPQYQPTTFHTESPYAAAQFEFENVGGVQSAAFEGLKDCEKKVIALVTASPLTKYDWKPNRGIAPIGYLNGLALTFARVYAKLVAGDYYANVIAKDIDLNSVGMGNDAISYNHDRFTAMGLGNIGDKKENIRKAFIILIALGMRESSGRYYVGVHKEGAVLRPGAANEEAGLFQISANLGVFSKNPDFRIIGKFYGSLRQQTGGGLLEVFKQGLKVRISKRNRGADRFSKFQDFCFTRPGLSAELAALGLRFRRTHWGPLKPETQKEKKEPIELNPDAAKLFADIQTIVDSETDKSCFLPGNWVPTSSPNTATQHEVWGYESQSEWKDESEWVDGEGEEEDEKLDYLSEDEEDEDYSAVSFEDEEDELFEDSLTVEQEEQRGDDESSSSTIAELPPYIYKVKTKGLEGLRIAVFVPANLPGRSSYELLFYLHGLLDRCPQNIAPQSIGKIVAKSTRPMVLAAPIIDWRKREIAAQLGKPAQLNALLAEIVSEVSRKAGTPLSTISRLVIAGHSKAYAILYPLMRSLSSSEMTDGALARLREFWMLDATYGCVPIEIVNLMISKPGLNIKVVYKGGSKTDKFGARSLAGRLTLQSVGEGHCDIPAVYLPRLLAALPEADLTGAQEMDDEDWISSEDYEAEWEAADLESDTEYDGEDYYSSGITQNPSTKHESGFTLREEYDPRRPIAEYELKDDQISNETFIQAAKDRAIGVLPTEPPIPAKLEKRKKSETKKEFRERKILYNEQTTAHSKWRSLIKQIKSDEEKDARLALSNALAERNITVDSWFNMIVPDATFLGLRIKRNRQSSSPGVHKLLYKRLQSAELKLMNQMLGVGTVSGLRQPLPATDQEGGIGYHSVGLAIDIDPKFNPFIRSASQIVNRAMQFVHGESDFDLGKAIRSVLNQRPKLQRREAARQCWSVHDKASRALRDYFGFKVGELTNDWKIRIEADRQSIERGETNFGNRKPWENGYMRLPQALVEELVGAGLTWGGMFRTGWDIMHFDCREDWNSLKPKIDVKQKREFS